MGRSGRGAAARVSGGRAARCARPGRELPRVPGTPAGVPGDVSGVRARGPGRGFVNVVPRTLVRGGWWPRAEWERRARNEAALPLVRLAATAGRPARAGVPYGRPSR